MIWLTARLAFSGGRQGVMRIVITLVGIAVGVAVILFVASVAPALEARAFREAQRGQLPEQPGVTGAKRPVDGTLVAQSNDVYLGRDVTVLHMADGSGEAPPGLGRIPRPGELFLSPEVLSLADPVAIEARYAGTASDVRVSAEALLHPDELVVWKGWRRDELARSDRVNLIRQFPLAVPSSSFWKGKLALRLGLVVALVGLLVPVMILIGVMTRLGAAQRAERFSVLKLLGAADRHLAVMASGESALVAAAATSCGCALFFASRGLLANVAVGGAKWFPSDFSPGGRTLAAIALAIPLVAGLAGLVGMRRVMVSPLGVARRSRAARSRRRWTLLALPVGLVLVVGAVALRKSLDPAALMVLAGSGLAATVVALPAAGSWLTERFARMLAASTGYVPLFLAARRVEADAATAFRATSGVMVGIFVATVFYGYTSGDLGNVLSNELPGAADVQVQASGANPHAVEAVADQIDAPHLLTIRRAYIVNGGGESIAIASCEALNDMDVVSAEPCPGPSFFSLSTRRDRPEQLRLSTRLDPAGRVATLDVNTAGTVRIRGRDVIGGDVVEPAALPESFVSALPVGELLVDSGGSRVLEDELRIAVVNELPGYEVVTRFSLDERLNAPLRELKVGINVLVAIVVAVAVANLVAATTMSFFERRRALTLLRAGGVSWTMLLITLLVEALLPLSAAVGISVVLGLVTSMAFAAAVEASFSLPLAPVSLVVLGTTSLALAILVMVSPMVARATQPRALRTE